MREQGILIPNKEYREREGVSSTDLKKIAKSPAHFRYWKDHPQEDTPSLLFGRAGEQRKARNYGLNSLKKTMIRTLFL